VCFPDFDTGACDSHTAAWSGAGLLNSRWLCAEEKQVMWFGTRRSVSAIDVIWPSKAAKQKGILDALYRAQSAGTGVLLVTHFEDTLEEIKRSLESSSMKYHVVSHFIHPQSTLAGPDESDRRVIGLCLSDRITVPAAPLRAGVGSESLEIVVAERYPIEDRDDLIISFARARGMGNDVHFHSSLEDILLKMFGSDRVMGLLKQLVKDDESPIVGKQISGALRAAQRKVKKKAVGDQRARSARDWFTYNIAGRPLG
jgi:preprotein translocase subunit SecA